MRRRRYREEVVQDLTTAARWYEGRREGLGGRFLEAVEQTMLWIEENPERFPLLYEDFRRALVQRPFPYQVYFRAEGQSVLIYAVLHGARDPEAWKSRLP